MYPGSTEAWREDHEDPEDKYSEFKAGKGQPTLLSLSPTILCLPHRSPAPTLSIRL